jgi:hypothetical protein
MLANPNSPETVVERQDVQAAARAINQQLIILDVNGDHETETAFATFVQRGAGALLCGAGAFFNSRRDRVEQDCIGKRSKPPCTARCGLATDHRRCSDVL